MNRSAALFLFIVFISSCVTHDLSELNTCRVVDPINDLEWLQDHIRDISKSSLSHYWYITQATYQDQTVFLIRNCCPNCGTVLPVFNCEGDRLFNLDVGRQSEIRNEQIIWRGPDFACTV